jgi:hypothetical protein
MLFQFAIVLLMIVLLDKKNVVDAFDVKVCRECKWSMGRCVPQYDPVYNPPPPDCCYITENYDRYYPWPSASPTQEDVLLCSLKHVQATGQLIELITNLPVKTVKSGSNSNVDFTVKTNCPPDHAIVQQVNAVEFALGGGWPWSDNASANFSVPNVDFSQPIYAKPTKPSDECSAAFNLPLRQEQTNEAYLRSICPHLFPTPPPTVCAIYWYCASVFWQLFYYVSLRRHRHVMCV